MNIGQSHSLGLGLLALWDHNPLWKHQGTSGAILFCCLLRWCKMFCSSNFIYHILVVYQFERLSVQYFLNAHLSKPLPLPSMINYILITIYWWMADGLPMVWEVHFPPFAKPVCLGLGISHLRGEKPATIPIHLLGKQRLYHDET